MVQNAGLVGFISHPLCFISLSSCLHGFWREVRCNSLCLYRCFSPLLVSFIFFSNLCFSEVWMICVGIGCMRVFFFSFFILYFFIFWCLMLSENPGSVVCYLTLIWRNYQSLSLWILLLFLSFFFWYSNYVYVLLFVVVPQFIKGIHFWYSVLDL